MTWEQEQKEAEARARKNTLLEIAHNMKAGGETVEKIMSYTGLTAEQIAEA